MIAPEVIALWTEVTGEKWRLVPYRVQQEALDFIEAGFTREEVQLVIAYTRRQILEGRGGFNDQSVSWRVLAEDRWAKFQERLSLAQEALRRRKGAARPEVAHVVRLPDGREQRALGPAPVADSPRVDVGAALRHMASEIAGAAQTGRRGDEETRRTSRHSPSPSLLISQTPPLPPS